MNLMDYQLNIPFKKIFTIAVIALISYHINAVFAACPPAGSGIVVNGTNATETGCVITTAAANTPGTFAQNSGTINLSNSTISTTGANSYGAHSINTNSIINLTNTAVTVTNAAPIGLLAEDDSLISLNNSSVNTISTAGAGTGATADAAFITLTNGSSITTQGNQVEGIFGTNLAGISLQDSSVSTTGANSVGIDLNNGATADLINSSVSTTGANAIGIQGVDSFITLSSNSLVHTEGSGAIGLFLLGATEMDLTDSTVETTGNNAFAVQMSGVGTNILNATNTVFSAANQGLFFFSDGDAVVTFNNVTGNASGSNRLIDVAIATLTFDANDSELSGDILVAPGGSADISLANGTTYAGAMNGLTGNLTLDDSSWNLTGDSEFGNLTNGGSIVFAPPTPDYKTLSVNNYIGQSGTIQFNTLLGNSASPTDLLVIDGGSATGTTIITINNTGGLGALTLGNGILLINAINGATTTTNAFSMTPFEVGMFRYSLFRGGSGPGEADNWYLRSLSLVPASVAGSAAIILPAPAGQVFVPAFREFVSLHATIPSMALLFNRMILSDGLHQRVGEEEQLLSRLDLGERPNFNGFWVRVLGQNGNISNGNIFHDGPDFDFNFAAIQPGVDIYHGESAYGQEFIGVFAVLGRGHSNVDHFVGAAGNNNMRGYAGALYWTHFDNAGWYLDGVLDATFTPINSDPVDAPSADTNGKGVGLSLEGGYPFKFNHAYAFEPEAQIIAGSVSVNNMNNVVPIEFDNSRSIAARLGARLTKTWAWQRDPTDILHLLTGWLFANAWREFDGQSTTNFNTGAENFSFDSTLQGNWAEFGIGFSGEIAKNTAIYASGERQTSLSGGNLSGYAGSVGVRVNL